MDRRFRKLMAGGTFAVLCGVLAGLLLGHFAWSNTATVRVGPGSQRSFGAFLSPPSGSGEASERYGGSRYGSGVYGEEGIYEGGGSSAVAGSVPSSITSKVDPALVNINTVLGVQGGAAAGTGMVVTSTGEVITNNHVITGATSIRATDVGNGRTYTAHVVGYDYGHDIAVLQLEGASGLQTVSLGNSSEAEVGESIATIGNAGGTNGTPSAASGKIAGLGRSITAGDEIDGTEEHLTNMIEIEGDLEPGDSGGPLVNSSGQVLGMDTAASQTFQLRSQGEDQGFAIPIDEVKSIASQILAGNSSSTVHIGTTGFLGVMIGTRNGSEGALVERVIEGTPAAGSGLAAGDLITEVDGTRVSSSTPLSHLILAHQPGSRITIGWETPEGSTGSATVTLTQGPPQ